MGDWARYPGGLLLVGGTEEQSDARLPSTAASADVKGIVRQGRVL